MVYGDLDDYESSKGYRQRDARQRLENHAKISVVYASPPSPCRSYQFVQRPAQRRYRSRYDIRRGKEKNKHADKRTPGSQGGANKAVVLGIVERDGELRAVHVPDAKAKTLQGEVLKNVAKGAAVLTDEDRSFIGLDRDYTHLSVNHSQGEYVRLGGFVHTNTAESVWALLKRQIFGIHHWVSDKHLNRYVSEMTWRFNRRDMKVSGRMNDLFACVEGRLTYTTLIG